MEVGTSPRRPSLRLSARILPLLRQLMLCIHGPTCLTLSLSILLGDGFDPPQPLKQIATTTSHAHNASHTPNVGKMNGHHRAGSNPTLAQQIDGRKPEMEVFYNLGDDVLRELQTAYEKGLAERVRIRFMGNPIRSTDRT